MNAPRSCHRCGAALTEETCARCLLELGLEPPLLSDEPAPSAPSVRMVAPSIEELAAFFPDLEVEALIGQGGMGAVFRARQKKLDRVVALKVLPREISGNRDFADRFLREARALARLSHPSIVGVHEYGETNGICWLLLEYVDGSNLRGILRAGLMESRQALALVRDLCDALQYAHDEGVVHRDIKPENVLVDRRGRAKIADFGLAKLIGPAQDANLTREGQVMGTPHYMAPEQIERPREVDHRADIYALGVVLYEMLTGSLPRGNFEPPSRRVQVDVKLDEIVLKALEHEPSRRYQHAVDVKTDVDLVEDGAVRTAEPAGTFGVHAGIDERGVFAEPLGAAGRRRGSRDAAASPGDVLHGWRGFALCVVLWIALAAAWNLGAFAFGFAFVAAVGIHAARIRARLTDEPDLCAALADEGGGHRALRVAGAAVTGLIGLAVVALGHVAHWERGIANWAPGHASADALLASWRANVWSLVPPSAVAAPGAEPRIGLLRAEFTGNHADILPVHPLVLVCVGLVILWLAVLVAVQPARRVVPRADAARLAAELGAHVAGALVFLWIAAPIAALRTESTLESHARSFRIAAPVADVGDTTAPAVGSRIPFGEAERRLRVALVEQGLRAQMVQVASVTDARSGALYADLLLVRGSADSPFDRWRTSWGGARRAAPELWISAARVAGAASTEVRVNAGLYPPGSPESAEADRLLAAIESALVRDP